MTTSHWTALHRLVEWLMPVIRIRPQALLRAPGTTTTRSLHALRQFPGLRTARMGVAASLSTRGDRPLPRGPQLRDLRLCGLWERRWITPAGWPGREGDLPGLPASVPAAHRSGWVLRGLGGRLASPACRRRRALQELRPAAAIAAVAMLIAAFRSRSITDPH